MKRLDKFSLLIENEEMGKEVKRIADKAGINKNRFNFMNPYFKYYSYYNSTFFDCNSIPVHPLITFDQFKAMFEPKIIGYKCPMDLYGGEVPKDSIYIKCYNISYYEPKGVGDYENEMQIVMPAEIVETWEPVYEEVNTELDNLKNEVYELIEKIKRSVKDLQELKK